MHQVYDGYHKQWPIWGTKARPSGVTKAYIAMVVILTTFYVAGLALLPKQYEDESNRAKGGGGDGSDAVPMSNVAGGA